MILLIRKEREKAAMLTGRSFNSTSKIDSFARILFPLTFTLFNVIYWMHYFKVPIKTKDFCSNFFFLKL